MSSENMTVIDRIYEAFETRDFPTFLNLLSPVIHITQCPEIPWGGVYLGFEEAKAFFRKVNTYLENHVAIERVIDGGERIAVIGRTHVTIKGNGRRFDLPIMHLWKFQDGLAIRLEIVIDVQTMQAADGRPLRRYRRRWRVERLFAWLHHFRRLVIRWEYHVQNFFAMVRLGRIQILLRQL